MIIKQAFSCDTDNCIYFDAQEEDCGKGSITIQEGRCCDCEKRQGVPESQPLAAGFRITINNEDFTPAGVSDYLESIMEEMDDEIAQADGNHPGLALYEERKAFFRAAVQMLRGIC